MTEQELAELSEFWGYHRDGEIKYETAAAPIRELIAEARRLRVTLRQCQTFLAILDRYPLKIDRDNDTEILRAQVAGILGADENTTPPDIACTKENINV